MKTKIILFTILCITAISFSSCSEEAIEPSTSRSDATGVTVHDENW